jgi:glycosyltransferase involved in cell wall biosynthesis
VPGGLGRKEKNMWKRKNAFAFGADQPLARAAIRAGWFAPSAPAYAGARQRLAVVSADDELCGIGAYCRALEKQLSAVFEVTVFGLDQTILRDKTRRARKAGDKLLKEICRNVAAFNAVNLQLEHGTLGRATSDIYRRFGWILAAAPQISVTFHTMPLAEFDFAVWRKAVAGLRPAIALKMGGDYLRQTVLSAGILGQLRRSQRRKRVAVIVHSPIEKKRLELLYGIREVYDHPLSFLSKEESENIREEARREHFPSLARLPAQTKLIGVFGFLSRYKGFDTVIRALYHLPESYHLLVFGGVHPNDIHRDEAIHPDLKRLLAAAHVDATLFEAQRKTGAQSAPFFSLALDSSLRDLLLRHPKDLSERIHFMGALAERDFLAGMAICDAVVMPYLEVGQSSSGPFSQSLELGCRVIASRSRTFLQMARYHKDRIEFFDIGNHLELAQRIAAPSHSRRQPLTFNVETNKAVYFAANRAPVELLDLGFRAAGRERVG